MKPVVRGSRHGPSFSSAFCACGRVLFLLLGAVLAAAPWPVRAELLDVWRAETLNLNDGDAVGTWSTVSNRFTANAAVGEQPILRRNATPAGGSVVRFNGNQRLTAPSPVGGRTAFSVALVFRAGAAGAGNNAQWWGKTGLVDAEQPGVTTDWGIVLTETGQVGIGSGNPDISTYSAGASVVDSTYHVAVFTWGAGVQAVYLDNRPAVTQSGVSSGARGNTGISLGGILT
ncbi:MAG TPA: hypothetical protein VNM37_10290, partial [Candidatus Dormibacteraeota bacterium]|nr:hypothetical protein [Candidatus Dormibacteraeota bacterium]